MNSILVLINGQSHQFPAEAGLLDVLRQLQIAPDRIAIEVDKAIVRKRDWPATIVRNGAQIEIVEFVGGG